MADQTIEFIRNDLYGAAVKLRLLGKTEEAKRLQIVADLLFEEENKQPS